VAENAPALEPAEAFWLLSSFCTIHQRTVDPDVLAKECAQPLPVAHFARVASDLEMEADVLAADADGLPALSPPFALRVTRAIDEAALTPADAGESEIDPASTGKPAFDWIIVLQTDATRALIARRTDTAPDTIPLEALRAQSAGMALRLRLKTPEAKDPDSAAASGRTFGFAWFVPELLKHKKIWRDVLLASLVLQLMSLAVPLFTQTIIDKVVVHRTQSTLIALAIGMAVFIVFTAALTWVRQHLVLHTGNRVDAVLGGHVFEHLFKLPMLYFQHRPTGVISARLQGIETIREFVSSAAVTLMLDLPFLLIFVAVMFFYSVTLTLVVLAILLVIVGASLLVAPLFQRRLNEQFRRGAANQAFVTEYVAALETVKSLQLEPQISHRYRELLAAFLRASFGTRQLANTYGTIANALDQLMTLLILAIGAWIVMTSASFTVGMLVAFQTVLFPAVAAGAAPGGPVAAVPAGAALGTAARGYHECADRALSPHAGAREGRAWGGSDRRPVISIRRAAAAAL
jgi:subfamily B ATP-binding cassette protein HlyB/CyaB